MILCWFEHIVVIAPGIITTLFAIVFGFLIIIWTTGRCWWFCGFPLFPDLYPQADFNCASLLPPCWQFPQPSLTPSDGRHRRERQLGGCDLDYYSQLFLLVGQWPLFLTTSQFTKPQLLLPTGYYWFIVGMAWVKDIANLLLFYSIIPPLTVGPGYYTPHIYFPTPCGGIVVTLPYWYYLTPVERPCWVIPIICAVPHTTDCAPLTVFIVETVLVNPKLIVTEQLPQAGPYWWIGLWWQLLNPLCAIIWTVEQATPAKLTNDLVLAVEQLFPLGRTLKRLTCPVTTPTWHWPNRTWREPHLPDPVIDGDIVAQYPHVTLSDITTVDYSLPQNCSYDLAGFGQTGRALPGLPPGLPDGMNLVDSTFPGQLFFWYYYPADCYCYCYCQWLLLLLFWRTQLLTYYLICYYPDPYGCWRYSYCCRWRCRFGTDPWRHWWLLLVTIVIYFTGRLLIVFNGVGCWYIIVLTGGPSWRTARWCWRCVGLRLPHPITPHYRTHLFVVDFPSWRWQATQLNRLPHYLTHCCWLVVTGVDLTVLFTVWCCWVIAVEPQQFPLLHWFPDFVNLPVLPHPPQLYYPIVDCWAFIYSPIGCGRTLFNLPSVVCVVYCYCFSGDVWHGRPHARWFGQPYDLPLPYIDCWDIIIIVYYDDQFIPVFAWRLTGITDLLSQLLRTLDGLFIGGLNGTSRYCYHTGPNYYCFCPPADHPWRYPPVMPIVWLLFIVITVTLFPVRLVDWTYPYS